MQMKTVSQVPVLVFSHFPQRREPLTGTPPPAPGEVAWTPGTGLIMGRQVFALASMMRYPACRQRAKLGIIRL